MSLLPWKFLKASCDVVEAVINRVSPIQGVREEAFRRSASFNALEIFEEENEVHEPAFPGEPDGLDAILSWPPKLVRDCADCGTEFENEPLTRPFRVCAPCRAKRRSEPYIYRDAATVAASAESSPTATPQSVGDTSEAGPVPPGPASHPTVNNITMNAPWPEEPKPKWKATDLTEDWAMPGLFPGGVLNEWGVVVGRFDSVVLAEKVVDSLNDYERLKRQYRTAQ